MKQTFRDISSMPLVVNTTLAPALRIFSILSFVMSDSLIIEKQSVTIGDPEQMECLPN
jgi:hypothetical protein